MLRFHLATDSSVIVAHLGEHVRVHHTFEKPYACPQCDYRTAYKGNVQVAIYGVQTASQLPKLHFNFKIHRRFDDGGILILYFIIFCFNCRPFGPTRTRRTRSKSRLHVHIATSNLRKNVIFTVQATSELNTETPTNLHCFSSCCLEHYIACFANRNVLRFCQHCRNLVPRCRCIPHKSCCFYLTCILCNFRSFESSCARQAHARKAS